MSTVAARWPLRHCGTPELPVSVGGAARRCAYGRGDGHAGTWPALAVATPLCNAFLPSLGGVSLCVGSLCGASWWGLRARNWPEGPFRQNVGRVRASRVGRGVAHATDRHMEGSVMPGHRLVVALQAAALVPRGQPSRHDRIVCRRLKVRGLCDTRRENLFWQCLNLAVGNSAATWGQLRFDGRSRCCVPRRSTGQLSAPATRLLASLRRSCTKRVGASLRWALAGSCEQAR